MFPSSRPFGSGPPPPVFSPPGFTFKTQEPELQGPFEKEIVEPDGIEEFLNWRGDPRETYSDWTIEIVTRVDTKGASTGDSITSPNGPDSTVVHSKEQDDSANNNIISSSTTTTTNNNNNNNNNNSNSSNNNNSNSSSSNSKDDDDVDIDVTTYHVHRSVLAFGKRKSEYFSRLFKNGDFQESNTKTSRIALESLAAEAFPILLDYLYFENKPVQATTQSSVALLYLGNYFGIKQLKNDAFKFVKEDMKRNLDSLETFYIHESIFHTGTVRELIKESLAQHVAKGRHIMLSHTIIATADLEIWLEALSLYYASNPLDTQETASKIVTAVACAYEDSLDVASFQKLTNYGTIRPIHHDVAFTLYRLENKVLGTPTESSSGDFASTPLRKSCIQSLASHWKSSGGAESAGAALRETNDPTFLSQVIIALSKM